MRRAVADQIRALRDLSDDRLAFGPCPRRRRPAVTERSQTPAEPRVRTAAPSREPVRTAPVGSEPFGSGRRGAPARSAGVHREEEQDVEDQIAASFMTDGNLAHDLRGSELRYAAARAGAGRRAAERGPGRASTGTGAAAYAFADGAACSGASGAPSATAAARSRDAAIRDRRARGGWVSDLLAARRRRRTTTLPLAGRSRRGPGPQPERRGRPFAGPGGGIAELAVGGYRQGDRPQRGGGAVGPLSSRVSATSSPAGSTRSRVSRPSTRSGGNISATASSVTRSTATSRTSRRCCRTLPSRTRRAASRGTTSPRTPARSTPCWPMPRDGSTADPAGEP